MVRKLDPTIVNDAVERYLSGQSAQKVAADLGISRSVISRGLRDRGIPTRTSSEAQTLRAGNTPPEIRAKNVEAAHAAVRGTKWTTERLLKKAKTIESQGKLGSIGERMLWQELRDAGLEPVPQKAILRYNVDLAVEPVAVEVLGGGWHLAKRHHAIRTPEILDQGWALLFIWNHEGRSALVPSGVDYAISYIEAVRSDPSLVGEYRVISGNGDLLTRGRAEDGEFPLVPPPRGV